MIFPGTKLRLKDNSGAIWAKCIKIYNCSQTKGLKPLGILLVSIKKIKLNKNKIEKGKMYKAILIRRVKNLNRKNGNTINFNTNSIVLLNEKGLPIASRIKGPVYKEFRFKYLTKVLMLSNFSV